MLRREGEQNTHTADLTRVLFSPDGTRALTCAKDQTAILWEVRSGSTKAKRLSVLRHAAAVEQAAFSANGERILTLSGESKLRAWSGSSGELLALFHSFGRVLNAGFASDGQSVYAIAENLVTRQRRVSQDTEEFAHEVWPMSWSFGAPRATGAKEGTVKTFLNLDAADRADIGILLAARQVSDPARGKWRWTELLHDTLVEEKAKTEDLEKIWNRAAANYRDVLPSRSSSAEFHEGAARECEANKEWFAAAWHCSRLLKLNNNDPAAELKLRRRRAEAYARADNYAASLPNCIMIVSRS